MSHLQVLFFGITETTTEFSLEDCTWLYALPYYQSSFFAANYSNKLHKAARASVKISCCTAYWSTPGLGKNTEPEFEPLGAVFANLHSSSWAIGCTSLLDWAAKTFLFVTTICEVYTIKYLSVCGCTQQFGSQILSGHHHTGAVMAPLAVVGLDRHVPTKCLNNVFLNNQLWSEAKSRDVFELAIFHLV